MNQITLKGKDGNWEEKFYLQSVIVILMLTPFSANCLIEVYAVFANMIIFFWINMKCFFPP